MATHFTKLVFCFQERSCCDQFADITARPCYSHSLHSQNSDYRGKTWIVFGSDSILLLGVWFVGSLFWTEAISGCFVGLYWHITVQSFGMLSVKIEFNMMAFVFISSQRFSHWRYFISMCNCKCTDLWKQGMLTVWPFEWKYIGTPPPPQQVESQLSFETLLQ